MKIEVKGFGPKKLFNVSAWQSKLGSTLDKCATDVQTDFLDATQTWGSPPTMQINSPATFVREITASGTPFKFVNFGTKVRYAHMTGDFIAKSAPGSMAAAGGSGGVAFINKKRPMPGIEARHVEKPIAEKRKDLLSSEIAKILPSLIK